MQYEKSMGSLKKRIQFSLKFKILTQILNEQILTDSNQLCNWEK
jgi:hypothetical protein